MIGRFVQYLKELICAWYGHIVVEFVPDRTLRIKAGAINYVPTPKLFTHLPVPEMPPAWILAQLPEERRQFIVERVMMLHLNPPIILKRTYCERCGEAW